MVRKSERNKTQGTPEKFIPERTRKSTRQSTRRRKKSSSESEGEPDVLIDKDIKEVGEISEPKPQLEPDSSEAKQDGARMLRSNKRQPTALQTIKEGKEQSSEWKEDPSFWNPEGAPPETSKLDGTTWKIQSSNGAGGGEIQKLKICRQRIADSSDPPSPSPLKESSPKRRKSQRLTKNLVDMSAESADSGGDVPSEKKQDKVMVDKIVIPEPENSDTENKECNVVNLPCEELRSNADEEVVQSVEEIAKSDLELPEPSKKISEPVEEIAKSDVELPEPSKEISEPVEEISKPVVEISEPVKDISKPVVEISEPVKDISKPVVEISEPVVTISEPVEEISGSVKKMSESVKEISEQVENVSETVENVSEQVENVSETVENVSETVKNVSEQVENVSEQVENVSEQVENVSEQVENVSEQVENVSETVENVSETVENVSETPEEVSKSSEQVEVVPELDEEVSKSAKEEITKPVDDEVSKLPEKEDSNSDEEVISESVEEASKSAEEIASKTVEDNSSAVEESSISNPLPEDLPSDDITDINSKLIEEATKEQVNEIIEGTLNEQITDISEKIVQKEVTKIAKDTSSSSQDETVLDSNLINLPKNEEILLDINAPTSLILATKQTKETEPTTMETEEFNEVKSSLDDNPATENKRVASNKNNDSSPDKSSVETSCLLPESNPKKRKSTDDGHIDKKICKVTKVKVPSKTETTSEEMLKKLKERAARFSNESKENKEVQTPKKEEGINTGCCSPREEGELTPVLEIKRPKHTTIVINRPKEVSSQPIKLKRSVADLDDLPLQEGKRRLISKCKTNESDEDPFYVSSQSLMLPIPEVKSLTTEEVIAFVVIDEELLKFETDDPSETGNKKNSSLKTKDVEVRVQNDTRQVSKKKQIVIETSDVVDEMKAVGPKLPTQDNHRVVRKISLVNEDMKKARRSLSPSGKTSTDVLFITNLVRPFTVPQLRELLARTGTIAPNGFYIDKIKSKCYVKYTDVEMAVETRHALNGVRWPVNNPKTLKVEFATVEDMTVVQKLADEETATSKKPEAATEPTVPAAGWLSEQSALKPQRRVTTAVREWDVGKEGTNATEEKKQVEERPAVKPAETIEVKKRPSSPIEAKYDPPARKIKKRDNDAPARLLDDLFRKTKTTPCIYWLPLTADQIAVKEEMRRQHMAEHERRLAELRKSDQSRRDKDREKSRDSRRKK